MSPRVMIPPIPQGDASVGDWPALANWSAKSPSLPGPASQRVNRQQGKSRAEAMQAGMGAGMTGAGHATIGSDRRVATASVPNGAMPRDQKRSPCPVLIFSPQNPIRPLP